MKKNYEVVMLDGLLFPLSGEAKIEKVAALSSSATERIPSLKTVFEGMESIAIHKTRITLNDVDNVPFVFDVFFRYDEAMGDNQALRYLDDRITWRGDMFTLKVGHRVEYVGIKTYADRHLAEQATSRVLLTAIVCAQIALAARRAPVFPRNIDVD
ncbi:hypothetical protein GALMADRAFT_148385 [Galerina marginata CBS 339.88]|uniref:Uncharacterized protein n=1 Tax=Galerina marginata (strain CBS 339.88) TaxID=685588 RepID=A0A067S7C9_GALM3|nr:hypothetical protein GALMADRAFT_148385 [Galerina marginata CBS 339.88]